MKEVLMFPIRLFYFFFAFLHFSMPLHASTFFEYGEYEAMKMTTPLGVMIDERMTGSEIQKALLDGLEDHLLNFPAYGQFRFNQEAIMEKIKDGRILKEFKQAIEKLGVDTSSLPNFDQEEAKGQENKDMEVYSAEETSQSLSQQDESNPAKEMPANEPKEGFVEKKENELSTFHFMGKALPLVLVKLPETLENKNDLSPFEPMPVLEKGEQKEEFFVDKRPVTLEEVLPQDEDPEDTRLHPILSKNRDDINEILQSIRRYLLQLYPIYSVPFFAIGAFLLWRRLRFIKKREK
jgi:hypothetical protein